MYYVFLKNGAIVDVVSENLAQHAGISDRLLNGEIDEIKRVADMKAVQQLMTAPVNSQWFEHIGGRFENWMNGVLDKLETAPNTSLPIWKKLREVGSEIAEELKRRAK